MRYIHLLLTFAGVFLVSLTAYGQGGSLGKVDPCKLQGSVFIEQVESFADYKVFVEDVENFADLLVFKELARSFADRPGLWYITDVRGFADFTVAFTPVKGFADFSIYFTDFKSIAGCRK
jgi:Family of unknown function (DUF6150)